MNSLDKVSKAAQPFGSGQSLREIEKLPQIAARAKTFRARARNDQRVRFVFQFSQRADELFEIGQHGCANFVARSMVERQLNRSVNNLPRKCLALKSVHAVGFR